MVTIKFNIVKLSKNTGFGCSKKPHLLCFNNPLRIGNIAARGEVSQ